MHFDSRWMFNGELWLDAAYHIILTNFAFRPNEFVTKIQVKDLQFLEYTDTDLNGNQITTKVI